MIGYYVESNINNSHQDICLDNQITKDISFSLFAFRDIGDKALMLTIDLVKEWTSRGTCQGRALHKFFINIDQYLWVLVPGWVSGAEGLVHLVGLGLELLG